MSAGDPFWSYYGSLKPQKPYKSFSDSILKEYKTTMLEYMKAMEDRLKRHITEAKREVIKKVLIGIKPTDELKEIVHGSKLERKKLKGS